MPRLHKPIEEELERPVRLTPEKNFRSKQDKSAATHFGIGNRDTYRYLIVDEASMVDIELASSLLSALSPNSSLLMVGDRDQLPSVGPGSVLKDIIASELAPVIQLTQVYRQAAANLGQQYLRGVHLRSLLQLVWL